MGEAINLVNNFKVEKVIFNCGEFNELEQDLIKVLDKKKIPPILANKLTDGILVKVICFLTLQMEQVSPFMADLGRLKESNLD